MAVVTTKIDTPTYTTLLKQRERERERERILLAFFITVCKGNNREALCGLY
jgi:hypothetical protein